MRKLHRIVALSCTTCTCARYIQTTEVYIELRARAAINKSFIVFIYTLFATQDAVFLKNGIVRRPVALEYNATTFDPHDFRHFHDSRRVCLVLFVLAFV